MAGVFRFIAGEDDRPAVLAMAGEMSRRGPDDDGLDADGPLTLGHRRLAILDLSPTGHQPMRSESGRFVVSFNGEIYNHDDVRRELGVAHEALRSSSDTEILLFAWERWGVGALDHLVGQWAFAMYDRHERRLWLARDRFGEKPLFYHHGRAALSFASSIPALLRGPGVPRALDRDAMVEYTTLRYVVSPRTVIMGIRKVAAGHVLRVDATGTELQRWYRPRFRRPPPRSRADAVAEFGDLLTTAARRCMVSDVPVALLLSDGIDSNAIRAALGDAGGIRSFTFALADSAPGFTPSQGSSSGDETFDLRVTPADRIAHMLPAFASFGEPVGDGAALATWLLIRRAREQATVFLCGHGGDEVLGGYRLSQDRFRLAVAHRLAHLPGAAVRPLLDRVLNGAEPYRERLRQMRDATASRAPEAARFLIHRPLPVADVATLLGRPLAPGDEYLSTVDRLYGDCDTDAADLDRMQEVMLHTFLTENILSFADAMAMDSSAELRMPFLDRDLVAFVLSLPPAMRVGSKPGRTNTKQILRWWAEGRVAPDVLARRKRGFPFGNLPELLATPGDVVRGRVLASSAVRAALPGVENWLSHPPEYFRSSYEGTLWALLSLGIWCEHHGVR
ncbi:MAG TPA: asparagine synthase (glutamine-hydrolyzing) [Candidatus Krumholzibacteria bacterium]|nr:asparagine synthase (glutamine-hydrolyzing) [Candidatus Krumholzibacteria bacterium]